MQTHLSVNHRAAEGLVAGFCGHSGLSPVACEVEGCRQRQKNWSMERFPNQDLELTNYHCTDEQAENDPEHPEQPLAGGERGRIEVQGGHREENFPRSRLKSTYRLSPDARQDEEQTHRQQQEDEDDGEQAAAEDEGSPLERVEWVDVIVESHLGSS